MPPGGSPFTRMGRVLAGACAHLRAKVPADEALLHEVEGEMSIVPGQVKLDRSERERVGRGGRAGGCGPPAAAAPWKTDRNCCWASFSPIAPLLSLAQIPCRTNGYRCLEKACTVTKPPGVVDRWLVTLTEVEEMKTVMRLLPIMLTLASGGGGWLQGARQ